MIDFKDVAFLKLKPVNVDTFSKLISPIFIQGESILASFQTARDGVVFTNFRIIAIDTQGVTGKKKDITSLPYSKIQAFSVETAGVIDLDSELELYFIGLGNVKFEFTNRANITEICQIISSYVLR